MIINYCFGLWIGKTKARKAALAVSVTVDIAVLGFFKYFNFLGDSAIEVFRLLGNEVFAQLPRIALPIGISFFTFQIMSYLIDVYYDRVPVQHNFIKLGLYIMLFPQLVAGPIVRYADVNREIDQRETTTQMLEKGTKRFIVGFSKKMLLANAMGKVADAAFGGLCQ